jgi:hypothetical protein
VALGYHKKHFLESLEPQFLDHSKDVFMELQIDLLCEFTKILASSNHEGGANKKDVGPTLQISSMLLNV